MFSVEEFLIIIACDITFFIRIVSVCVPQEDEIKVCVSSNVSRARRIFEEHGHFLRIIIRLHIRDESDADDFFQELFLFLILKPLPENISSIRGLLNKIVADRVKDFYRKKGGYKRRIGKYAGIVENKYADSCPENLHIEKEEAKRMFKLIRGNLPPKEAQAVILRYKYGHDNEEISEKMGIKPRSVVRYISVGMSKIKKMWA